MTDTQNRPGLIPPPDRHQLALMIWLCVFPTLTAINVTLGDRLASMSPVVRTFVLATVAVPIVIYGLMPHLHRARARLFSGRARGWWAVREATTGAAPRRRPGSGCRVRLRR